jgi:DNA-binding NarL/FixJ family response regulator
MARGFARLRERNQLTMPQAVVDKMRLNLGDLVEFAATNRGTIELLPARIVTMGTAEAKQEEEVAREDIRQGRYSAVKSLDQFQQHVDQVRRGDFPSSGQTAVPETALVESVSVEPTEPVGVRFRPHDALSIGMLSQREREIVRMVAMGHPNKVIADALNVSSWTVSTYLRRLFAKLGVDSRVALVVRLLELGPPRLDHRAPSDSGKSISEPGTRGRTAT